MNAPTFLEIFCAEHHISEEAYTSEVFKRVLYRRALPFAWLLSLTNRNYFTADYDLIRAAGHLRELKKFSTEADHFHYHPYNRGWLRHRLGLRVSTNRLRLLVKASLPKSASSAADEPAPGHSRPAFPVPELVRDRSAV